MFMIAVAPNPTITIILAKEQPMLDAADMQTIKEAVDEEDRFDQHVAEVLKNASTNTLRTASVQAMVQSLSGYTPPIFKRG